MNRCFKEKGITLVALIVTIIILLILTAVTLYSIEKFGIINLAIKGTQDYQNEEYREYSMFEEIGNMLKGFFGTLNGEEVEKPEVPEETPEGWDKENVEQIESEDGVDVPIPKGYELSDVEGERSVKDGLVIKKDGNEYVWIPVSNTSNMFEKDSNGNIVGKLYNYGTNNTSINNPPTEISYSSLGFREPSILENTMQSDSSLNGIKELKEVVGIEGKDNNELLENWEKQIREEFYEMKESIETYGGFYIGRYETGDISKEKAVSAKDNTDIANASWYTFYQKSKTIAEGTSVKSGMIWGCQYDEVMRWLSNSGDDKVKNYVTNSTGMGNYTGSLIATGSNPEYGVKNIYDLAGNAWEWTMESYGEYSHVIRRRCSKLYMEWSHYTSIF